MLEPGGPSLPITIHSEQEVYEVSGQYFNVNANLKKEDRWTRFNIKIACPDESLESLTKAINSYCHDYVRSQGEDKVKFIIDSIVRTGHVHFYEHKG